MNEFMSEMEAKFAAIGTRFRSVRNQPEPLKSVPKPSDIEAAALESWAQDKDTRLVYAARLDRLIEESANMKKASIHDDRMYLYHSVREDVYRSEKAWILKVAGLANGPG